MVESVHALNDVHDQVGEADVVLHDQWIDRLRLDHIVHQVKALRVLQAAFCQTLVGALIIYSTTLMRNRKRVRDRCLKICQEQDKIKATGKTEGFSILLKFFSH